MIRRLPGAGATLLWLVVKAVGLLGCPPSAPARAPAGSAPAAATAAAPAVSLRLDGVAPWRGDARAAYSLIHDDVCDHDALGVFSVADPELVKRQLHAGFGVIAGRCDRPGGGTWSQVRTLVAHGHDVFGHSLTHPCMTDDRALAEACDPVAPHSIDFAEQVGQALASLTAHTGQPQRF